MLGVFCYYFVAMALGKIVRLSCPHRPPTPIHDERYVEPNKKRSQICSWSKCLFYGQGCFFVFFHWVLWTSMGQVAQTGIGETNQQKTWNGIFLETSGTLSFQDPMVRSAYKLPA